MPTAIREIANDLSSVENLKEAASRSNVSNLYRTTSGPLFHSGRQLDDRAVHRKYAFALMMDCPRMLS